MLNDKAESIIDKLTSCVSNLLQENAELRRQINELLTQIIEKEKRKK